MTWEASEFKESAESTVGRASAPAFPAPVAGTEARPTEDKKSPMSEAS